MKIFQLVIVYFTCFILSCTSQNYQIHVDESYLSQLSVASKQTGFSYLNQIAADSLIELSGCYDENNLVLEKYPVLRFYNQQTGLISVPISNKLTVNDGALIQLRGMPEKVHHQRAFNKQTSIYFVIEPEQVKEIKSTNKIIKDVTKEYQKIRIKLQNKMRNKGSKLNLSQKSNWTIWYISTHNHLLFLSQQHDLMYAAKIEFIVSLDSGEIVAVYAQEWFKGEK